MFKIEKARARGPKKVYRKAFCLQAGFSVHSIHELWDREYIGFGSLRFRSHGSLLSLVDLIDES